MKHTRTVKWILCLCCLLAALWAFTLAANAEIVDSGNCGVVDETNGLDGSQVTWTLDDAGTLTISGTGRMADYSGTEAAPGAPWFAEKNSIVKVAVGSGVTNVGNAAFSGCSNLQTVTLADGVTTVGSRAFAACEKLSNVTMPDTVTTVGSGAFSGCAGLKEIAIPSGVKTIGTDAFSGCTGLTKVHTAGVAAWCGISFANSAANPLTQAHHLYLNGSEIAELAIPTGVTAIGNYAFSGGTGLMAVTIPGSVTTIGTEAFSGCTGLAEIAIPSGVVSVGAKAFYGCTALDDISLATSVLSIGAEAFHNTAWYNAKVGGPVYLGKALYKYKGAMPEETEYDMKDGTLVIADEAFYNCANLRDINLPESLKAIGKSAFASSGLEFIVIPSAVTAIGDNAVDKSTDMYCDEGAYALTWANGNGRNCYAPTKTGKCGDNLTYKIYSNKTVIVSGKGNMWNGDYAGPSVWDGYCDYSIVPFFVQEVKSAIIKSGVTSLGDGSFVDCVLLQDIHLPKTLTSIGTNNEHSYGRVFLNCIGLKTITIPENVVIIGPSTFENCTGLISIIIPNNVTSIGDFAFTHCSNLTTITIGDSVIVIGNCTFSDCKNLISITIPKSVTSIGNYVFQNCTALKSIIIPNTLTSLGQPDAPLSGVGLFQGCANLRSVIMPENIKTIPNEMYSGCSSLRSIIMPETVSEIGSGAFKDCSSLNIVNIPANVNTIGASAFQACTGLTSFSILDNVTFIGASAFKDCTGLTSFIIPDSVTSVGASVFKDCTNLESVTIGAGVKTINNLFDGCTKLKSITLPDTVTAVAASAFSGYSWLKEITLSKNLKEIKANTFKGCDGLKNITIPGSVKTIGANAFEDCTELRWARLEPGVETLKEKAFLNCSSLGVICLPDSVTTIEADAIPEFTAIAGSVGSYAHQWAIANHRPFREVLTAANITLSPAAAVYNGKEQTTTVTVKNAAGTTLTEDTDYTLTVPEGRTAPGEYVYVVEGIGNYADTAEAVLTVREALTAANLTLEPSTVVYNGKAQTTALTVKNAAGTVLKEGTDYTVVIPIGMTAPGDYPFTVIGNGLYTGTAKKTFTIQKHEPHTWNDGAVTTPATCTADGVKTFTCTYCGDTKTEPVKATGHSYGAWTKLDETQHQCVCANDKTHVEKANHTWDDGKVTKETTCTEKGVKTYTCTVCNATKTEEIAAKGHMPVADKAVAATCTTDGKTEGSHCSVCNAVIKAQEPVKATGHSYGAWTKLDDAQHQRVCANDKTHIEKADHAWDAGTVTKEATAEAEGERTFTCTVCGAVKTEPIPKTEPEKPELASGDVDGDGKLTSADARLALRASVGLKGKDDVTEGSAGYLACDVDGDNKVTSADARLILRASVGLEDAAKFGKKA